MQRSRWLAVILSLVVFAASAGAEEVQLPAVPAELVKGAAAPEGVPAQLVAAIQAKKAAARKVKPGRVEASSETVKVAPGQNAVLVVAGNNLNRLITPFQNPVVNTVSNAKIKVDGSIVYVSLALEDNPTTLFITEDGEPEPAISVTLMPQQVAPREIRLVLEGGWPVRAGAGNPKAAKWEKSEPYLEALQKVVLQTARGEIPQGYNLRPLVAQDPRPACALPVQVEPAQVLEGHNLLVVVSRLTNVSASPLLINEAACYRRGVRAVAVWPKVQLSPQESTELYVVYGRQEAEAPRLRPSVLGGLPSGPRLEEPGPRRPVPEVEEKAQEVAAAVAD